MQLQLSSQLPSMKDDLNDLQAQDLKNKEKIKVLYMDQISLVKQIDSLKNEN